VRVYFLSSSDLSFFVFGFKISKLIGKFCGFCVYFLSDFLAFLGLKLFDLILEFGDFELGLSVGFIDLSFELIVEELKLLIFFHALFHLVKKNLFGGLVLELALEFVDFFVFVSEEEVEFLDLVRVGCELLFDVGDVVLFLLELIL